MSRKEARRPGLVQLAVAGKITTAEGARSLKMSPRQFRRLKARYRAEGVRGLVHRLRGRPSPRALDVEIRDRVVALIQTTYRDFNDCHCTEKLRDGGGPARSAATPSAASGGPSACRPSAAAGPRQHRARRPRRPAMGSLVLIDGSPFDWLGTGTPLLLLGAIDDATSTVVALHFRPAEDLHGYLTLLQQLAARMGLPVTLYGDRLGVFVRNDAHWTLEEELQGAQHPTQFGQILRDLGIGYIAAHSPQAKGRIERLWETLQDRLVAELRLARHPDRRGRRGLPAHLPRGPQPPLGPAARGGHGRVAPPAPGSRGPAELPLHAPRRPRQHRAPRPPPGPDPARPPRPLLRRLPRRAPRMPRWPPARRLSGPAPGHGARPRRPNSSSSPAGRNAYAPPGARPRRGAAISPFTKIVLRRPSRRSPPWPSTCAVPHGRTPGGRPSRAANANASRAAPDPSPP